MAPGDADGALDPWRIETDAALRSDIRRLGDELGRTLVRQVGSGLLARVEEIRDLSRRADAGEEAAIATRRETWRDVDALGAIQLARAFTTCFHLATVAEQTHRISLIDSPEEADRGRLPLTVDRILRAGLPRDDVQRAVERLEIRPVVTAHPTEASRRSVLGRLADIGALLVRALGQYRRSTGLGRSGCLGTRHATPSPTYASRLTFAQVSRSVTARFQTGAPGAESGSAEK